MFESRHFDGSVILLCVRWYLAYSMILRDLEKMMAERGISVDHATIYRWLCAIHPNCSSASSNASERSPASGALMKSKACFGEADPVRRQTRRQGQDTTRDDYTLVETAQVFDGCCSHSHSMRSG
jgi:hypothetical protein